MAGAIKIIGYLFVAGYLVSIIFQGFTLFAFLDISYDKPWQNKLQNKSQTTTTAYKSPDRSAKTFNKFACAGNPFRFDSDYANHPHYHFVYREHDLELESSFPTRTRIPYRDDGIKTNMKYSHLKQLDDELGIGEISNTANVADIKTDNISKHSKLLTNKTNEKSLSSGRIYDEAVSLNNLLPESKNDKMIKNNSRNIKRKGSIREDLKSVNSSKTTISKTDAVFSDIQNVNGDQLKIITTTPGYPTVIPDPYFPMTDDVNVGSLFDLVKSDIDFLSDADEKVTEEFLDKFTNERENYLADGKDSTDLRAVLVTPAVNHKDNANDADLNERYTRDTRYSKLISKSFENNENNATDSERNNHSEILTGSAVSMSQNLKRHDSDKADSIIGSMKSYLHGGGSHDDNVDGNAESVIQGFKDGEVVTGDSMGKGGKRKSSKRATETKVVEETAESFTTTTTSKISTIGTTRDPMTSLMTTESSNINLTSTFSKQIRRFDEIVQNDNDENDVKDDNDDDDDDNIGDTKFEIDDNADVEKDDNLDKLLLESAYHLEVVKPGVKGEEKSLVLYRCNLYLCAHDHPDGRTHGNGGGNKKNDTMTTSTIPNDIASTMQNNHETTVINSTVSTNKDFINETRNAGNNNNNIIFNDLSTSSNPSTTRRVTNKIENISDNIDETNSVATDKYAKKSNDIQHKNIKITNRHLPLKNRKHEKMERPRDLEVHSVPHKKTSIIVQTTPNSMELKDSKPEEKSHTKSDDVKRPSNGNVNKAYFTFDVVDTKIFVKCRLEKELPYRSNKFVDKFLQDLMKNGIHHEKKYRNLSKPRDFGNSVREGIFLDLSDDSIDKNIVENSKSEQNTNKSSNFRNQNNQNESHVKREFRINPVSTDVTKQVSKGSHFVPGHFVNNSHNINDNEDREPTLLARGSGQGKSTFLDSSRNPKYILFTDLSNEFEDRKDKKFHNESDEIADGNILDFNGYGRFEKDGDDVDNNYGYHGDTVNSGKNNNYGKLKEDESHNPGTEPVKGIRDKSSHLTQKRRTGEQTVSEDKQRLGKRVLGKQRPESNRHKSNRPKNHRISMSLWRILYDILDIEYEKGITETMGRIISSILADGGGSFMTMKEGLNKTSKDRRFDDGHYGDGQKWWQRMWERIDDGGDKADDDDNVDDKEADSRMTKNKGQKIKVTAKNSKVDDVDYQDDSGHIDLSELALYIQVFGAVATGVCAHAAYRITVMRLRSPVYLSVATLGATSFGVVCLTLWSKATHNVTENHWSFGPYIGCFFYILLSAIVILTYQFCVDLRSREESSSVSVGTARRETEQPFVETANDDTPSAILFPSTGLTISVLSDVNEESSSHSNGDNKGDSKPNPNPQADESTPLLQQSTTTPHSPILTTAAATATETTASSTVVVDMPSPEGEDQAAPDGVGTNV